MDDCQVVEANKVVETVDCRPVVDFEDSVVNIIGVLVKVEDLTVTEEDTGVVNWAVVIVIVVTVEAVDATRVVDCSVVVVIEVVVTVDALDNVGVVVIGVVVTVETRDAAGVVDCLVIVVKGIMVTIEAVDSTVVFIVLVDKAVVDNWASVVDAVGVVETVNVCENIVVEVEKKLVERIVVCLNVAVFIDDVEVELDVVLVGINWMVVELVNKNEVIDEIKEVVVIKCEEVSIEEPMVEVFETNDKEDVELGSIVVARGEKFETTVDCLVFIVEVLKNDSVVDKVVRTTFDVVNIEGTVVKNDVATKIIFVDVVEKRVDVKVLVVSWVELVEVWVDVKVVLTVAVETNVEFNIVFCTRLSFKWLFLM
jgi:hypothetical protein